MNVIADNNDEKPCLGRLQTEALQCLDTFPNKIVELNNAIHSLMPPSLKTKSIARVQRTGSATSTVKDNNPTILELDETNYYPLSTYLQNRSQRGVYKKRCYNLKGYNSYNRRRKPGPLGQLLTFIAENIAKCTKSLVLAPSWFIIEKILSLLPNRRQLQNTPCGPSTDWSSSTTVCASASREDNSAVVDFINVIRPAAVQLIADTTILKKWLQALTISLSPDPPSPLLKAIRIIETIDCWAYELFFSLKCYHGKRKRNSEKVAEHGLKMVEDIELVRLWNRLIQMRNNYIMLYETLRYDKTLQKEVSEN